MIKIFIDAPCSQQYSNKDFLRRFMPDVPAKDRPTSVTEAMPIIIEEMKTYSGGTVSDLILDYNLVDWSKVTIAFHDTLTDLVWKVDDKILAHKDRAALEQAKRFYQDRLEELAWKLNAKR